MTHMQQTPHPSARAGVPPGVLNSSPPIWNYLPKTFTMEKVLPKCSCGEPVHSELVIQPVYDDGGALLCVDQDWLLMDECRTCLHNMGHDRMMSDMWDDHWPTVYDDERDESPF